MGMNTRAGTISQRTHVSVGKSRRILLSASGLFNYRSSEDATHATKRFRKSLIAKGLANTLHSWEARATAATKALEQRLSTMARACYISWTKMSSKTLRRWAYVAKGPQHLVQIGADTDLVVEKILQPEVVVPFGEGDERQQIGEADAHGRRRRFRVVGIEGFGVNAQLHGHRRTSLSNKPGESRRFSA